MGGFNVRHGPQIKRQPISWLWPGYIPRRKMTVLTGDPGLGKSWVAWDFAARVTSGRPWPDGTSAQQGNVLILSAEDDAEDTIMPRLDRLGADDTRIWIIEADAGFNLQTGLAELKAEILRRSAVLVIIDPFTAFLGKIDSFKDPEVRELTSALKRLLEDTGVAILAIMHHNKSERSRATYRILGSIAFKAAPRSHYMIGEDPTNEDRYLFMCGKLNIQVKPKALAFRLSNAGPVWEPEPVPWAVPDVVLSSMVAGEERTARDRAVTFLAGVLEAGEVLTKDVYRLARNDGHGERTVDRAREHLGVHARRDTGLGVHGKWYLHLPPAAPYYPSFVGCLRCKSLISLSKVVHHQGDGALDGALRVGTLDGTVDGARAPLEHHYATTICNGGAGGLMIDWDAIKEEDGNG